MLTNLSIQGFRSCHDVTIGDIGEIVALVGRNGAGKTNILHALERIANWCSGLLPPSSLELPEQFSFSCRIGHAEYEYQCRPDRSAPTPPNVTIGRVTESLWVSDGDHARRLLVERVGATIVVTDEVDPIHLPPVVGMIPTLAAMQGDAGSALQHVTALRDHFRATLYEPLDEASSVPSNEELLLVSEREYAEWQAGSSRNPGRATLLQILDSYLRSPGKYEEFRHLLGQDGLGLIDDVGISSVQPAGAEKFFSLVFRTSGDTVSHPYGHLSLGTRRIIRLIASLVLGTSRLLLLEQPEDAIHPGLLRKLIGIIRSYTDPLQVLLTSHSPVVLDELNPSDVRLVSMNDGQTEVRALTPDEVTSASQYVAGEGALHEYLELVEEA